MLSMHRAFLLKKIKYGENGLILKALTEDEGLMSFFAPGRISRGKSRISLEPMSSLEIIAKKGNGDLFQVREIKNDTIYPGLLGNIYKSSMVLFVNEVLINVLKSDAAEPGLYEHIGSFLNYLNVKDSNYENAHLIFLARLCSHLGFQPHGRYCNETPVLDIQEGEYISHSNGKIISGRLAECFSELMHTDYPAMDGLGLSNVERRNLLGYFLEYFQAHIDQFGELKSREVLESVLS